MKTIFLHTAASILVLAAAPVLAQLSGKIETVANEGREISVGGKKALVDDERTAVTIAGKPAKRAELKPDMQCKVYTGVRMNEQRSGRQPPTAAKIDCN